MYIHTNVNVLIHLQHNLSIQVDNTFQGAEWTYTNLPSNRWRHMSTKPSVPMHRPGWLQPCDMLFFLAVPVSGPNFAPQWPMPAAGVRTAEGRDVDVGFGGAIRADRLAARARACAHGRAALETASTGPRQCKGSR